jgi:hypothetical protein
MRLTPLYLCTGLTLLACSSQQQPQQYPNQQYPNQQYPNQQYPNQQQQYPQQQYPNQQQQYPQQQYPNQQQQYPQQQYPQQQTPPPAQTAPAPAGSGTPTAIPGVMKYSNGTCSITLPTANGQPGTPLVGPCPPGV